MGDALRPSDDEFNQVLQESLKTWTSYLATENNLNKQHLLPQHAINMRPLVSRTPPFLGDGIVSSDETFSFASEEKESENGKGGLVVNGRSTWRTSEGICDLPPKVLPKQLLLAVSWRLNVELSEDSPLSEWPGVERLPGYDKGNYLSVLYFAWAYIISARWVELLDRSADHECHMDYNPDRMEDPSPQSGAKLDIGDDACEEEVLWWRAILCSNDGWNATVKYNNHVYVSPWSISSKKRGFTLATNGFFGAKSEAPSSSAALNYLSRFCVRHRLYAQCSVALAGVLYIPFLGDRTISLPHLRQASRMELTQYVGGSPVFIPDLLIEHKELLPKYMTLSSNVWGLRSLLCSTFFNPDIECNLASAWLNPAFAIVDSISPIKNELAVFLANRSPLLGTLWLGAVLTGLAKTVLRDIRVGMTALDLPASAWTATTHTFMTCEMGTNNGESLRRDDECRLLYITASEGCDRPLPVWTWKPFGTTKLCDAELAVRQHAQCSHCLEYESWEWILANGHSIQDFGKDHVKIPSQITNPPLSITDATLSDYKYDLSSQSISEGATRGIFGWLRATGYPPCEKAIYQHSWIDLESTDEEEEPDDAETDAEMHRSLNKAHVASWFDAIE
ncbi:hypothetical protein N7535_003139 [Penicillium sp. DV-2018c]|nr:hypothetical protein N7461_001159 [Penicillium sp. DV-2018c]KAJ5576213.1 hypothetical protein N7535_003139 [Penicillium sp. DV-2018c]